MRRSEAGSAVTVDPVRSKSELRQFVDLPPVLYADDPNFIPPLRFERLQHLRQSRNPYFQHAEAQLFLARRAGRPVGRISAQIDRLALELQGGEIGHFGFFDAVDDPAVCSALFDAAEKWLSDRGMRYARGPFSFSINDECGLLVDGFDRPPSFMMGHARPYLASRVEQAGYRKARDLIAYDFEMVDKPLSAAVTARIRRLERDPSVVIRPIRLDALSAEVRTIMDVFNDAWSLNWGFVPFSEAEIDRMGRDMKMLLREEFVQIVELDGEAVAFGIVLPNLNEVLADLGGSLFPLGWVRLLYRLKAGRIRSGRVPLMGVRRRLRATSQGIILAYAIIDRLNTAGARHGFRQVELSWILEDNLPMRRMIEAAGGVPYKTYRVYEKAL